MNDTKQTPNAELNTKNEQLASEQQQQSDAKAKMEQAIKDKEDSAQSECFQYAQILCTSTIIALKHELTQLRDQLSNAEKEKNAAEEGQREAQKRAEKLASVDMRKDAEIRYECW